MPIEITTALIGVVSALLGGWAGSAISRRSAIDILEKEQFFAAASKFKATILYELLGFYPVDQYWDKKNFGRFYSSIPKILSAAAEFRFHVTRKDDFDAAIKAYEKYCRTTNSEVIRSDNFYPREGEPSQREQFKNIVDHLLSFADKI